MKKNKTSKPKTPTIDQILRLENQICFPLYAAARLIAQAYGPSFSKLKLTYPQYLVLLVLWENDSQSVKEIGQKLLLDSGTLTPVLKNMEKAGLVIRMRSPDDDRTVQNKLTKKALGLKEKAAECSFGLFQGSGLSVKEAQTLRTSLNGLVGRLLNMTGK